MSEKFWYIQLKKNFLIKGRKGTLIDSRVYSFVPYEVAKNTKQLKIK